MNRNTIKLFVQRSIVAGWRELLGGRVRRAGYLLGVSTILWPWR
jgi:hypothetical protein